MTPAHFTEIGTKVEGTYLGVPFSGTVESARQHTINYETFLVNVALDEPIDILGRIESNGVTVSVYWDGSNAESYSPRGEDSIRVREEVRV